MTQTMLGAASCRCWASAASCLTHARACAGRFDEKIRIIRPDTKGRYDILKVAAPSRAPVPGRAHQQQGRAPAVRACREPTACLLLPAVAPPGLRGRWPTWR